MRAYLFAVAGTVVISAILSAIAPEGKLSSTIKTAAKLVCLIVIAQPIAGYFVSVKNGQSAEFFEKTVLSTDAYFIKYCSKIKVASAEQAVETEIYDTYGVKANVKFDWSVFSDSNEKKILTICLTFSKETAKENSETIKKIQDGLSERYGVSVIVTTAEKLTET